MSGDDEELTHEDHDVVDIIVVDLDGDVVDPRLDTIVPPLRVDGRLENKGVRVEESFKSSGPGVAVLEM